MTNAAKKQKIDWPAIQADFSEGRMSNRELAAWYSISEGAIRKRAKAEGWVRSEYAPPKPAPLMRIEPRPAMAHELPTKVEEIVGKGRNLIFRMLDELDVTTSRVGEMEEIIDSDTAGDRDDRRRQAMLKAVSLPSRANSIKALAAAFKTLVESGSPEGKKAQAHEDAKSAGVGTEWGDDLGPHAVN